MFAEVKEPASPLWRCGMLKTLEWSVRHAVDLVLRRSRSGLWDQLRPDVVAWTILVFARLIDAIRGELGSASTRARELMEQATAARTRAGATKRDHGGNRSDLPPW